MTPEMEIVQMRARKLLAAARRTAGPGAPSPEGYEEAALGASIMTLIAATQERCADADKLRTVVGVIVTIAQAEGATLEETVASLTSTMRRLWPICAAVRGEGMTRQ